MTIRETMTSRERWQAALHMKPVDRLPFWPKIGPSYTAMQDAPFDAMSGDELHTWIGSDQHRGVGNAVRETRKKTSLETAVDELPNGKLRTTRYVTPHKTLTGVAKYDHDTQAWHPIKFPIESLDDIRAMTEFCADADYEFDADFHQQAIEGEKIIGDCGVIVTWNGTSPLMQWVEWLAGIEQAHYLLADYPEDVAELFDTMHKGILQSMEITAEHTHADMIYLTENTSTTLVSPDQYRSLCFPHLREYGEIATAYGKSVVLHMCGHLKDVLPDLGALPVRAFEAFTTPTLGNTTFLDGRTACPDKCLIGGTNAMLWLKPAREIIARIEHDLDELPHHRGIVVTSAGVMPPFCKPETIRKVCDWVKQYRAR